jgi:hypothetical protein
VEVLPKVYSMAAKAAMIADVGSKVEKVGERDESERRKLDVPRKGAFDPGSHSLQPAVDLPELGLDRPIAMGVSQRLLATLQEAELENMVVRKVQQWGREDPSITTMAQILEDRRQFDEKWSYLYR